MGQRGSRPAPAALVPVWDLPTRLFHWLVVLLVAGGYLTARANWMDLHVWDGTALLALVLFRVVWGVVGSETSRFAGFIAGPRAAAHHLLHLFRREPDRAVGHNPAGGWMVALLLATLLGLTITGIVTNNDVADAGPLTELMPSWLANLISDLHGELWTALVAMIVLHLAAIATYATVKRHNLIGAMITGRKCLPQTRAPRMVNTLWALPVLAGSAAVATLLANYL